MEHQNTSRNKCDIVLACVYFCLFVLSCSFCGPCGNTNMCILRRKFLDVNSAATQEKIIIVSTFEFDTIPNLIYISLLMKL